MDDGDRELVKLTDAANPVEAGALREYLLAQGIPCFIRGEHHSSLLGHYGTTLIGMDVMVPAGEVARARELLIAFREAEPVGEDGELWDEEGDDDSDGSVDEPRSGPSLARKPRTAATLAIVPSFGFGHFYSGAFLRGGVLMATELVGLIVLWRNPLVGLALIGSAVLTDLIAGSNRARALSTEQRHALPMPDEPDLPRAKLLPPKRR